MTAQSRASSGAIGGYFFDECLFTQASSITTDLSGTMYLGRPYSAYAKVMIKYSYLDEIINPSGWKIWSTTDPRTDYVCSMKIDMAMLPLTLLSDHIRGVREPGPWKLGE